MKIKSCKDRILQPHRRKGQYKQEDRDEDQEWQVLDSHVRAFNRTLTDDTITTRQQDLDAHSNRLRGHRRVLDLILKVFIPAGYLDCASSGKQYTSVAHFPLPGRLPSVWFFLKRTPFCLRKVRSRFQILNALQAFLNSSAGLSSNFYHLWRPSVKRLMFLQV